MNTNPNPYIDDDLKALADTARRFAEDRVKPGFLERDQTRVLDRDLMREMGELGFIGPEIPEAFGGLGLGCLAAGVIHEEISRVDLNLAYINLLASLNGQILAEHGDPEVVGPWIRKIIAGEALCSIALTEPRGGSPPDPCEEAALLPGPQLHGQGIAGSGPRGWGLCGSTRGAPG